jgi:hypothetical protein
MKSAVTRLYLPAPWGASKRARVTVSGEGCVGWLTRIHFVLEPGGLAMVTDPAPLTNCMVPVG